MRDICRVFWMMSAFFCSIWIVSSAIASDEQAQPSRFNVSGFGTAGIVTSNSDELGFRRDMSQRDGVFDGDFSFKTDSLLGLQLKAGINHKLDAVFQTVFKERPHGKIDEKSLEQAFLRYQVQPSVTFRVGRMPISTYMLADYRNVGFAYLWARPATEFYGRIPFTSLDGADIALTKRYGNGTFRVELLGGTADVIAPLDEEEEWDTNLEPVFGINLKYEANNWDVQAGYAYTKIASDLPPAEQLRQALAQVPSYIWPEAGEIVKDLEIKGSELSYYSLGVSFDNNTWLVQSEVSYIDSLICFQPSEVDGYLSAGRRFGAFTPYLMFSMARPLEDIKELPDTPPVPALRQISNSVFQIINLDRAEQHTSAIGAKWDFHSRADIKLQWERTWVEGDGFRHWEASEKFSGKDQTIDTISCNLNFMF